jgi:hypothetical protein
MRIKKGPHNGDLEDIQLGSLAYTAMRSRETVSPVFTQQHVWQSEYKWKATDNRNIEG